MSAVELAIQMIRDGLFAVDATDHIWRVGHRSARTGRVRALNTRRSAVRVRAGVAVLPFRFERVQHAPTVRRVIYAFRQGEPAHGRVFRPRKSREERLAQMRRWAKAWYAREGRQQRQRGRWLTKGPRIWESHWPFGVTDEGIVAQVNRLVPTSVPEQIRADVCQELILRHLQGQPMNVKDVSKAMRALQPVTAGYQLSLSQPSRFERGELGAFISHEQYDARWQALRSTQ